MLLRSDAAGDNSNGGGRASDNEGNVEQRRQLDEVVALGQALERLQVSMSMGMPSSLHLPRGQPCGKTHGCAEVPAVNAPEMRFLGGSTSTLREWRGIHIVQASRLKKLSLFGHLFFNITNVFCAKKRVGHACICPRNQDGHWLASFEVIPPPKS